jgi:deoxycytidylate deaminase
MTKTERAMFRAAKSVSEMSDHRVKVGCVVVNKHRIVSSGYNSHTKCHKTQAMLDKAIFGCECPGKLHSETAALLPLIKDGIDLSRASIFVYREHKDGSIACAKPCARCERLIKKLGIKRVYFTIENGFAEENW